MRKRWMALAAALCFALAGCGAAENEPAENTQAEITPYGTMVEVDGGSMNVLKVGEGETEIVWLPGFTDIAPALSYTKMLESLAADYTVYVVEPFGYGLSDVTDKPRTIENITAEAHEAVQKMGAEQYVLLAHSISGVYAMEYVNDYRDEVLAFIGLDTSTPDMRDEIAMDVELGDMTGVTIPDVSDEINEQYRLIAEKVSMNANWADENARMSENFEKAKAYTLPADLPVAFFLAADAVQDWAQLPVQRNDWVQMHTDLIPETAYSHVEVLEAGHLMYQTHPQELTEKITAFLAELPAGA